MTVSMSKNLGALLFCAALALPFAASAGPNGSADVHQKAGVTCEACHKTPNKAPDPAVCLTCHTPDQVLARTEKVKPTTPHVSPHYDLTCVECHGVHKAGKDFCAQCHKFDFVVK